MRCLVIGGAGFLGQSITLDLSKKGVDEIIVMDLPEREVAVSHIPNVGFVAGSYLDLEKNDSVFTDVDSVVYLATNSHPKSSMIDIECDAQNNINPAIRMMDSCRYFGVNSVVFASSGGAIYGDSNGESLTEEHPKAPLSAYGVVKLTIENYLQLYQSQFGLRTYCLRISNAYGPRQLQGAAIGSIANFLKKIVDGKPLEIWGDGSIVRDYIFIDDIVDAFTRCVLNSNSTRPGAYNIGSGEGYTLNQVIAAICEIVGLSAEVNYSDGRDFDVQSIVLDTSKMKKETNWCAQTNLHDGIRLMYESLLTSKSHFTH